MSFVFAWLHTLTLTNLIGYGVGVLIIVAAVVFFSIRASKKRKKRREDARLQQIRIKREQDQLDAPIQKWLRTINFARSIHGQTSYESDSTILGAGEPHPYQEKWADNVRSALEAQAEARARMNTLGATVNSVFASLRTQDDGVDDLYELIKQALETHENYISDKDIEWAEGRLDELYWDWCDDMLAEALDGNAESFNELWKLEQKGEWPPRGEKYPLAWAKVVGRYVENPSVRNFGRPEREAPALADAPMLAARAIRTKSLPEAKLLLAFCRERRSGDAIRDAMGPILWTDLVKMVEKRHAELRQEQVTSDRVTQDA